MDRPYGFGSLDLIRTATLAVGLLRLDGPVLLADQELARLVAPRQFFGVSHRLSFGLWPAIGALRRALKPQTERDRGSVPHVCVRTRSGRWLTLLASANESRHLSNPCEIVIVIEPAGFKEMAWLHTAAYGLSPREGEVVEFVVRGASTRQISRGLYVTEDTAQKHLQNVFEKVAFGVVEPSSSASNSIPSSRRCSRTGLPRSCAIRLQYYFHGGRIKS
jgi:Bacterial regulatory proteins, luxR family